MDEEVSKKIFDDELDHKTVPTFLQTLQNCLKVCAGKNADNLAKDDSQKITYTTFINVGNSSGYLLPLWKNLCRDKNFAVKNTHFKKTTKKNISNITTGGSSIPPIGDSFNYIETNSNKFRHAVFGKLENTVIFHLNKISFCYDGCSNPTSNTPICLGRFKKQL